MNKSQLQAAIAALNDEIGAVFKLAEDEKRALTADERKGISDREAKIAAHEAEIKQLDADEEARRRQTERQAGLGRRSAAGAVGEVKDNFIEDPKKGFKDHREFLTAVMDAGRRGGITDDKRLRYLSGDRWMAAGADEQSTVSDAYGGFLLPVGFSPTIMAVNPEADPTAGLTTKIPMSAAQVPINARVDKNHSSSVSGGFTVGRRAETQAATSSRQSYEQVVLNAHSLMGIAYASEELLARSPQSFAAIIEAGFRDEFPAKMLSEKLSGIGVGCYEGAISAPATVSVSKETGQAAATILFENLAKMRSRCWGYSSAIWLYNHDCLPTLMNIVQAVGTGGVPAWQPSGRDDRPDMLFGRPAYPTEFLPAVGTVGDILLGNWSQYLEGTLTPLQSAESMHVRFENHERVFKFWTENDGRCWWRSALTPKVSTTTLSPFVTLATRS